MEVRRGQISVCLVTFNRRELLLNALESLARQTIEIDEIILVDNASSDGTADAVVSRYPDVKLICLHENKGCPPARNIAMANSGCEFVAHLDDDGAFAPDAIAQALEVFQENTDTGIVMMDIIEDGHSRSPRLADRQELPVFSGGCSVFRREVLGQCGYFDDAIFRQGEEYDYSVRMFDSGWKIRFCREARMYHYPPEVLKTNPRIQYMGAVNKSLALVKYAPAKYLWRDLPRRLAGNSLLMLRKGRIDLALMLHWQFWKMLPSTLKRRRVAEKGYEKSRDLHRTYLG